MEEISKYLQICSEIVKYSICVHPSSDSGNNAGTSQNMVNTDRPLVLHLYYYTHMKQEYESQSHIDMDMVSN